VFLRCQMVRGELGRDSYLTAMRNLIEATRGDARLAPVATAMNTQRLLLEEDEDETQQGSL